MDDNMDDLYVEPHSKTETVSTTLSASSANSLTQKKRKTTLLSSKTNTKLHSNCNHTAYFFKSDPNDSSITYCKVCEINLSSTQQKLYPYNRRDVNTMNLINYLHDKHDITKENYIEFLDKHNELLFILQNSSFYELILTCEPDYKILYNKTVKAIIYDSFLWSKEQLRLLLNSNVVAVHLTTNLWTAKSCHSYLSITAIIIKKTFASNYESGETYDIYFDLIYRSQSESDKKGIEDSDSSTSERDEIPSGSSCQHWQYAHRQFRQKMRLTKEKGQKKGKEKANNSYRHKKGARKKNSKKDIDDFNNVEYLLAADTDGLLKKI
ncbi:8814_t:CDS:2 [Cetraspora pellucida]|uniref:8814_t:CDS:1 n=1 Tax=Cetraspora pellucida TaxID=1433469 RepID=A0ACA9KNW3_9GLOM|nr:8814_t:CDS:2 [Cetraspora pellucida]